MVLVDIAIKDLPTIQENNIFLCHKTAFQNVYLGAYFVNFSKIKAIEHSINILKTKLKNTYWYSFIAEATYILLQHRSTTAKIY